MLSEIPHIWQHFAVFFLGSSETYHSAGSTKLTGECSYGQDNLIDAQFFVMSTKTVITRFSSRG